MKNKANPSRVLPKRKGEAWTQKLLATCLSILLTLSLMPAFPQHAYAEQIVTPAMDIYRIDTYLFTANMYYDDSVGAFGSFVALTLPANFTLGPRVAGAGTYSYSSQVFDAVNGNVIDNGLTTDVWETPTRGGSPSGISATGGFSVVPGPSVSGSMIGGGTWNYSLATSVDNNSDSIAFTNVPLGTGNIEYLTYTASDSSPPALLGQLYAVILRGGIFATDTRELTVWVKGTRPATTLNIDPIITAADYLDGDNETGGVDVYNAPGLGSPVPGVLLADGVSAESGDSHEPFLVHGGSYNGDVVITADGGLSGPTANRVGLYTQTLTATDNTDNTTATANRRIAVKAANAPDLNITYAAGALDKDGNTIPTGTTYSAAGDSFYPTGWTNQDLNITVSSNDPGIYDLALKKGSTVENFTTVNAPPDVGIHTYLHGTETPGVSGEAYTGIMLEPTDQTIVLSPETTPQTVKVDQANPSPHAIYSAGVFTVDSQDLLSGIDSVRTRIAVVPVGDTLAQSDFVAYSSLGTVSPGTYNVHVWAWDNAGNNVQAQVYTNFFIQSTTQPTIAGELASGSSLGTNLPSNTWTNQDVKVTVTPPIPEIGGNYYSSLYEGTTQEAKASVIQTPVDRTYTSETAGTSLIGRLVDASDVSLANDSSTYILRIDKTRPVGDLDFDGNPGYGFTDKSTDTLSPVGANSNVDFSKTVISIVPSGAPEPAFSAYSPLTGQTLPVLDHWDVWVIATDYAGNESLPVKALEHISRNNLDEITAFDFSWDIASGSAGLTDDMAKMLSHVVGIPQGSLTPYPLSSITVDSTQIGIIRNAINSGLKGTSWPLAFETPSGPTQAATTINVTLFDSGSNPGPGPTPGPLTHELIYGNHFNWGISTGSIGDAAAKTASFVKGYYVDGTLIPLNLIGVDQGQLGTINTAIAAGLKDTTWPLTFYTPDGTSAAVWVTLFDEGPSNPQQPGVEHVVGNDFNWGITTGTLTEASAEILGRVAATGASGTNLDLTHVSASTGDLAAINAAIAAGQTGSVWPLTFTTDGSTGTAASTIVRVTLFDDGAPVPPSPGSPYIVSNDFRWPLNRGDLSADAAKTASMTAAYTSLSTRGNLADITVDQAELAAINADIRLGIAPATPLDLTFAYSDPTTLMSVSVTAEVTLFGNSDIEIIKVVDKTEPLPGETITYTMTVVNNGIAAALGVWIKDYVPAYTSFVSCDASGIYGATVAGREFVNWFIPSLAVGTQQVLTMQIKIDECVPGTGISNVALFEETGSLGPPINFTTTDPGGGQSNAVSSTVADPNRPALRGLPSAGDNIWFLMSVGLICALLAHILLAGANRMRRVPKDGLVLSPFGTQIRPSSFGTFGVLLAPGRRLMH